MNKPLPPYVVLDKQVGETPLACQEAWRAHMMASPSCAPALTKQTPLAYAGRLDPMASGKLLILIGDECKNQETYFGLDKAYDFSVLLGIGSDTHDVLGRLAANSSEFIKMHSPNHSAKRAFLGTLAGESPPAASVAKGVQETNLGQTAPEMRPAAGSWGDAFPSQSNLIRSLELIASDLTGPVELPYPHFSSKTVQGKPLHMWTLEGRLDEIEIPTKQSTIYNLELTNIEIKSRQHVCEEALTKINTIPPVTDPRKILGNDFRRTDVRADWQRILIDVSLPGEYTIAHFHCVCSSGTYMRTLAKVIGQKLNTQGLAWHIHRTNIGTYDTTSQTWTKSFI